MTVALSVSELLAHLREAVLREAAQGTESTRHAPSHRLIGQLFHAVAAEALGPSAQLNVFCLMEDLDAPRKDTLEEATALVYDRLLGPRLTQHHNVLHPLSAHVLALWEAVRSYVDWLTTLAWQNVVQKQPADRAKAWEDFRGVFKAEVPVEATLTNPDWLESVRLTGVADLLMRIPHRRHWCAIELKTGNVPDELALLQACLYQIAIEAEGVSGGAVSVLRVGRDVESARYSSKQTAQVRQRLFELIGAAAGITQSAQARPVRPPKPPTAVKQENDPFAERLVTAYADLGLGVRVADEVQVGPTFRRYRLELARNTRWGQVKSSIPSLEVRLGATTPMTLTRDVGRIYLDVQREDREAVYFRDVPLPDVTLDKAELLVGVDIAGRPVTLDLADPVSPHVLVAGTTGSGKSEWLTLALTSLARGRTPDELRLILVDPKRTAFGVLATSPFLWDQAGVVMPPDDDPVDALALLTDEMERRYGLLAQHGAKDLSELRARGLAVPPRLVCACDEFMDVVLGSEQRREIERLVARIGAKARAAGIHLILATQQPRRDVLSGLIQSNLPARIALQTAGPVESRLMQCPGAERLLGKGDLLFRSLGEPQRLQAPLVATETRDKVLRVMS